MNLYGFILRNNGAFMKEQGDIMNIQQGVLYGNLIKENGWLSKNMDLER